MGARVVALLDVPVALLLARGLVEEGREEGGEVDVPLADVDDVVERVRVAS
jgi:hypothetical protein